MANIFQEAGRGIKAAAEDVAKAVAYTVEFLVKAESLLATAIKDQPEVKAAVLGLIQRAETVIGDLGADIAGKGVNLAADAKTLADAEAFFAYFQTTFIPLVESLYATVKADIK